MRRLLVVLALSASIPSAIAGELDFPTLRGNLVPESPTYLRWSGVYAGGQVGWGNSGMDFKDATQPLVAFSLRTLALENEQHPSAWQVLGASNSTGSSIGGFVGYNTRYDDVILGIDFNYSRTSFFANASISPITRVTSAGGNTYLVTVIGDASMRITDVGTLRLRAGYSIDNWLPYATLGVAVGRADYTRSATVSGQENPAAVCPSPGPPPCTPFSFTETDSKNGALIYGWAAGGGLDVMVMPQVFVRAEYEYVSFVKVGDIRAYTSIGRLGVGMKF